MPIRVYIVEDHPLMRETLVEYFEVVPDIEVCGVAESAEEAIDSLARAEPSLVLLDLSLPGRSGVELIHDIRERLALPCVVLSGHREPSYVGKAFAAGAQGYVLKGRPSEISAAIRNVMEGKVYLSNCLRSALDGMVADVGA